MEVITGKSGRGIDLAIAWSCNDRTDEFNKFYYMAFSLRTWTCDQLKPTTGQRITFKKHITSISCTLEPAIQSGNIGQWIPFLIAVNKVKQIVYALDT